MEVYFEIIELFYSFADALNTWVAKLQNFSTTITNKVVVLLRPKRAFIDC